jgi:Putative phage tail protein
MATIAINLAIGFASAYLLNLLSPTVKQEGPRLNDLSAPKSSYGAGIPRVYGSVRLSGNFMWGRNIREVVSTQRQGGKGGGGGVQSTTYTYYGTFATLLCEGEIVGVKRIWLNSKIVYNVAPDADTDTYNASLNLANKIRFYNGTSTQGQDSLIAATEGVENTPAYRGRAYLVFDDLPLEEYGNRIPAVSVEVVQSGYWSGGRLYSTPTNVGAAAQNICQRVGFDLTNIDTTEINDIELQGFWTNTNLSARDALGQLQRAFFFDAIESGGKLKFIKQIRPDAPLAIPLSDLACYEYGQERPDNFTSIRTQDTEIVDEVSVTYLDPDFAYQQASQTAKRQISPNKNKEDIKFDIVLTASQALQITRKYLYLAWAQRRNFSFNLSLKYCQLEPGDVASIPFFSEDSQLLYITKINIGANFLLECEGIPYEPSLLALSAVATAPAVSLGVPNPSDTDLQLLDINLIKDNDSDFEIYTGGTGNSAWRQGGVYVSRNGGDSYNYAKTLLTKTIVGTCGTTLGSASEFTRDLKNTLTVTVQNGELESIGETDFLNGRNCALVGEEILYFKNASLVAGNTYTISELLRGRRGTEWAINSHGSSENFVLLSGYIERIVGEVLDLNSQRLYKALSIGQVLEDVTPVSFTATGKGMKPYAPCHIKGVRDGSGNLTISWVRRTRKGGVLVDYKDADLSELSESYEIDILSGTNVFRTLNSGTQTITYTAAQQITDFGLVQSSVNVKIYQMSGYVGRGYAAIAVV